MKFLGQFIALSLIFTLSATGIYQMYHYTPIVEKTSGRFPASTKGKSTKNSYSVDSSNTNEILNEILLTLKAQQSQQAGEASQKTVSGNLHSDFFKTIDDHYQVYDNYGNGTSMCHHFKVENKSDGMRHLMIQMSNFINRRCITETVVMNGPFYLFNDFSKMFFLACCDKVDSNHAVPHFRFERTQDLKNHEIRELRQLIEQK